MPQNERSPPQTWCLWYLQYGLLIGCRLRPRDHLGYMTTHVCRSHDKSSLTENASYNGIYIVGSLLCRSVFCVDNLLTNTVFTWLRGGPEYWDVLKLCRCRLLPLSTLFSYTFPFFNTLPYTITTVDRHFRRQLLVVFQFNLRSFLILVLQLVNIEIYVFPTSRGVDFWYLNVYYVRRRDLSRFSPSNSFKYVSTYRIGLFSHWLFSHWLIKI